MMQDSTNTAPATCAFCYGDTSPPNHSPALCLNCGDRMARMSPAGRVRLAKLFAEAMTGYRRCDALLKEIHAAAVLSEDAGGFVQWVIEHPGLQP